MPLMSRMHALALITLDSAYRKFEEWTQQYGPIFSLRQGFSTTIVIGRMQAAIDVMERDGAWLVDRPRNIAAGETLSGGMRMLLTPAGDRFKKMRRYGFSLTSWARARGAVLLRANLYVHRAIHTHLQPKAITSYTPSLMKNARQHILDIIADPARHQDHAKRYVALACSPFHVIHTCVIYRYSAAVVMALAYGKNPKSYADPEVVAVNRCLTRLGETLRPGVWKVEAYPFLRYTHSSMHYIQRSHK